MLKDHLGNTRVTFKDANNDGIVGASDIYQTNNYYPFGLNMEGNWNSVGCNGEGNKYQYNGKEWNDDFGLGWNHHDWRFLDVAINRFVTLDPEADEEDQESFSPYHFALDNPIRYDDPDGRNPILGAILGATVEYGTQVATNIYNDGLSMKAFTNNINVSAIVVAGAEGALTSGASAGKKIAVKVAAALVNNTVEVKYGGENGETGFNYTVEKNPSNIIKNASIDIVADAGAKGVGKNASKATQKVAKGVGVTNANIANTAKNVAKATNTHVSQKQIRTTVKTGSSYVKKTVNQSTQVLTKASTDQVKNTAKKKTDFPQP